MTTGTKTISKNLEIFFLTNPLLFYHAKNHLLSHNLMHNKYIYYDFMIPPTKNHVK